MNGKFPEIHLKSAKRKILNIFCSVVLQMTDHYMLSLSFLLTRVEKHG